MCPISGMVQFLIVIVTLLLALHAVVVRTFNVSFTPNNVTLRMDNTTKINYEIWDVGESPGGLELLIYSEDRNIASMDREIVIFNPQSDLSGAFNLTGNFLGQTVISCKNKNTGKIAEAKLDVIVVRRERFVDKLFNISVAVLVSIIYINFGCAIDWSELRGILRKPIGPVIGLCGHFVIMPLLSFGLGKIFFPDNPEMQLGLFFSGITPAGGASNMWAVLLEGNLNLSVIMTATSTKFAFLMIPFWTFTLGRVIFKSAKLAVPYILISSYVAALLLPLIIGYLIQRYLKRISQFMTRILKGLSMCLILFIIIFAIVTNLYMFQLFSWQIIMSGMALPWIGYLAGYFVAKLCKQTPADCLTVAIEVGIQNTGIAIFLLRFTLPQPQADLTTVAPVSVAMLTPFPLLFLFVYKKLRARLSRSHSKLDCCEDDLKVNNGRDGDIQASEVKLTSIT